MDQKNKEYITDFQTCLSTPLEINGVIFNPVYKSSNEFKEALWVKYVGVFTKKDRKKAA